MTIGKNNRRNGTKTINFILMRPIERIDNFLELVDWDKLLNRWGITDIKHYNLFNCNDCSGESEDEDGDICFTCMGSGSNYTQFVKYWKENSDQRIGQVLINLDIISDTLLIWLDEESDILLNQGIAPEACLYWTSIYDKNGNLLDKPISKLLKDLDTDHIVNIYRYVYTKNNKTLLDTYDLAFNNVLTKRKAYKELEEIQLICITHVDGIAKKN